MFRSAKTATTAATTTATVLSQDRIFPYQIDRLLCFCSLYFILVRVKGQTVFSRFHKNDVNHVIFPLASFIHYKWQTTHYTCMRLEFVGLLFFFPLVGMVARRIIFSSCFSNDLICANPTSINRFWRRPNETHASANWNCFAESNNVFLFSKEKTVWNVDIECEKGLTPRTISMKC